MNLGTPIAIGNTARIYLHENTIVKLFNDDLPDSESSKEADKQKFAYSCGLSVPKVLDVTRIDGKQAILMEHIEGRTLGELLFKDMEQAEHYINISVEVQQKIHSFAADSLEPI